MSGRLIMRQQDNWWVAYYALANTEAGMVELGRIMPALLEGDEARTKAFVTVFADALSEHGPTLTAQCQANWAAQAAQKEAPEGVKSRELE
jgi:hypothetical protein